MGDNGDSQSGRFVIQLHDASQRHYDFRLEVEGVLKSWAVPKGPSTDPADKGLTVEIADHDLDYADFAGVIPEGHYGAGTVMAWNRGSYRNLADETTMSEALENGLIEVWLAGEKIAGGYALKRIEGGGKPQWLLIKMRDDAADARRNPVSTEPQSVKTGCTLDAIGREEAST